MGLHEQRAAAGDGDAFSTLYVRLQSARCDTPEKQPTGV
jgi:hypothetical protein